MLATHTSSVPDVCSARAIGAKMATDAVMTRKAAIMPRHAVTSASHRDSGAEPTRGDTDRASTLRRLTVPE
jgi:hypothetical protein